MLLLTSFSLFPLLPVFLTLINKATSKSILHADFGHTAEHRGFFPRQPDHFFVEVSIEAVSASTAIFCNAGSLDKISLRRGLRSHELSCTEESHRVGSGALESQEQCRTLLYPYIFNTYDEMPATLRGFYTSGFCA